MIGIATANTSPQSLPETYRQRWAALLALGGLLFLLSHVEEGSQEGSAFTTAKISLSFLHGVTGKSNGRKMCHWVGRERNDFSYEL